METSRHGRLSKYEVAGLALVALIGLMHIAYPFDGDQALFTEGALKISRGAILYRDFWDIKQPGIFVFYLIGGLSFGFTELGIHLFELIYMLILAVVLLVTVRTRLENRSTSPLIPLLTVGFYYAVTGTWHLTQVEGLVCLPLYLTLWFSTSSVDPDKKENAPLFASGLFGGITILFKFIFAPILLAFWILPFYERIARRRIPASKVIRALGFPLLCGLMTPLVLMTLYFAYHHAVGELGYALFTYPSQAVTSIQNPVPDRLINGLKWFLLNFSPLIALSVVGAFRDLRMRFDHFTVGLLLWVVSGLGVILIQKLSWWEYQYMLLFPPLGILAVKGIDAIWSALIKGSVIPGSIRGRRLVAASALLALFSPLLMSLALKGYKLFHYRFALSAGRRSAYQDDLSPAYRAAREDVSLLSGPDSLPGSIFVSGNPVHYLLSGREQAIASNGWMLELFLPEQWRQLEREMSVTHPSYIFVANEYASLINDRSPKFTALLKEHYTVGNQTSSGTWYALGTGRTSSGDVAR
jgi:hypothetical protein